MKRYVKDSDMIRYIKGKQTLLQQGLITQAEYDILMELAGITPVITPKGMTLTELAELAALEMEMLGEVNLGK